LLAEGHDLEIVEGETLEPCWGTLVAHLLVRRQSALSAGHLTLDGPCVRSWQHT
jgi:hypothetical protein